MFDQFGQDVFVEGSSEVALEEFVVVDCLGDDTTDKLEVVEVVGVDVGKVVNAVGDSVTRTALEQGVVGVEDFPGDDDIPLPEQPPCILPLLS